MGVSKEVLVDLQEKYEKVRKLIEEDSKTDPENEPYLSKYAAHHVLISMKASLEKLLTQQPQDEKFLRMLGIVWFYLGLVSVETEEFSTGEHQLNTAISLTESRTLEPGFVLIMLNALNQLGILWSNRDNADKSKEYLERSMQIYIDFKKNDQNALGFNEVFQSDTPEPNIEKTHTLTLYYLAQVYGILKLDIKSAICCHDTLKRQLEFDDYEHIDWALNAATLSQFFMEKNGFQQARHHLAAASYMLANYDQKSEETYKHRSADVSRCWAKYGLALLSASRDRLLDSDHSAINIEVAFNLDLHLYEQQITDQFALTFDDARAIFLCVQTWLTDAQLYYSLENHASDYVQIIQDTSQLFSLLAFFEDDPERQSKMHKRRADHLESVVKELNPVYYLQVCRQIWYELGEIYITILEIKLDKLRETSERPSPHALTKINNLVEKSIHYFTCFIDSVKESKIPDELEKPVLKAYFHVAAMYGKFIILDKRVQLENNKKSLEYFKKLTDYCAKYEVACQHVATEIGVSKEMVQLLPLKIIKIQQEINA